MVGDMVIREGLSEYINDLPAQSMVEVWKLVIFLRYKQQFTSEQIEAHERKPSVLSWLSGFIVDSCN